MANKQQMYGQNTPRVSFVITMARMETLFVHSVQYNFKCTVSRVPT